MRSKAELEKGPHACRKLKEASISFTQMPLFLREDALAVRLRALLLESAPTCYAANQIAALYTKKDSEG